MSRRPLAFLVLALTALPASAEDAFEFYREEAAVAIASRRLEPAWRAPAAVDVVTAEDIAAYGFQNIWDALRFRAGMDVLEGHSANGNRAIVSARGFSRDFVSEMQVLVDGRSVYSPFLGGVYWGSLPVQVQDIARIEIVRGPNAVLYGSNAALGVINIITKKPGRAATASASVSGGNRSLATAEAAEAGGEEGGVRVSHSFDSEPGHPRPDGTADETDFLHANTVNARARWTPDAATEVELLAGDSRLTQGIPGFTRDPRGTSEEHFALLRGERRLESAGTLEASLARAEHDITADPFFVGRTAVREYQYDGEVLHRFTWLDGRADAAWGGNARLSVVESDQTFAGRPWQQNRVLRGFTHHSVRVADRLTAAGGVSLEDSQTGGLQPAYQAALLLALRDDRVLRVSFSRAPTIPPLFNTAGDYRVSAGRRLLGSPDLSSQEITSWETGWSGREFGGALKSDLTLYDMTIRDRNFYFVSRVDPGPVTVISYDNRDVAHARGAELALDYAFRRGSSVFANYTFEKIHDDKGPTDAFGTDLSKQTPVHKANLGARTALGGWTLAAIVGYKDAYDALSTTRGTRAAVARTFRLDARVGWSPRPGWELFAAGQNLLQPYRLEYADRIATPRTYEAGVSAKFGP